MIIDTTKETIKTSKFVGHENVIELVEGDIIVPDVKPDILSLIKVDGDVYITKKTIQDDKVIVEGMVLVYAIYLAEDANNSIKGINALLNFSESIPMLNARAGMLPIVKYNIGPMEYRTLNGRKITVKCPINMDVKVMENTELEIIKDIPDNTNIQLLKKEIRFNSLVGNESEIISIKENVSIPDGCMPIGEILRTDVTIINKDYKVTYNKILAKAEAKVRVIYVADDEAQTVQTFETLIPVMGFVDVPGINDTMNISIDYNMLSFYAKPVYQDLKATGIYMEGEVELTVRASEERPITIIQDLYNPSANLKYDVIDTLLNQVVINKTEKIMVTEFITIPELDNSKILDITVSPIITEKKLLDDKIIVEGNSVLDILFYKIDKRTIETKRIEVPFQQVINLKGVTTNMNNDIDVRAGEIGYQIQGVGQLEVKMSLELNIEVNDKIKFNMIDGIEQTDELLKPTASMIIYYVKPGDSLWKIAKNYRTTIETIKEVNNLTDDVIYPGQQIIIPRRMNRVSTNQLI